MDILRSSGFMTNDWRNYIMIGIFLGLTAYDMQKMRAMYYACESEPEMLDKLEQSYNQNRQIYESAGQSFSRYEFCQWLDNHSEILFKGKTDKEFDNN